VSTTKKPNIVSLGEKSFDGKRWGVEQMMLNAIGDVNSGAIKPTKALVLFLDDDDGSYDVHFVQAGMSCSQMLALVEVAKQIFLQDMGVID